MKIIQNKPKEWMNDKRNENNMSISEPPIRIMAV